MAGAEERSRLLADLATTLTAASTDLDLVVQAAAKAMSELIGDVAVVRLTNDRGVFDLAAVHHPDPASTRSLRQVLARQDPSPDRGFTAQVRASGAIVIRNDLTADVLRSLAGPLWPVLQSLNIGAILMVPLIADDTYLGKMSCGRTGRDRPFTQADADLASDIAARVALAVAVARLVARLRTEHENYEQIMQTCAEGVWKLDGAGRTTFVNSRMADILGVTVTRMREEPAAIWLAEPTRPWWQLADGADHELRLRHSDGHLIWVQASVSHLPSAPGAPADAAPGRLAMITDITDRIRSRELGERVAQMQRLDSIGQLAGGVAHDFNNLLAIIGGSTELLLTEVPPESSAAALARQVANAVEQGAALTRQLLAFGRGRGGNATTIDVYEVLAELTPMLQRAIGAHIHLRVPAHDPAPSSCYVRIDEGQLHQVIVNLASNAADAMPAGGRLTIDCEHTLLDPAELAVTDPVDLATGQGPDKAPFVRLAVSDTGTGMDAATLRQAFEPFYTTKPAGQGTGLGLAGVYGIIRTAGGLVRLYSEPGHGTTVKIYLPAERPPTIDTHLASPTPTAQADNAMTRILIVEDNPALAEVLRRLLQPAGYHVTVTLTPAAALLHLDDHTADLVITDVVMPDLTGPELADRIHQRQPDLPIIYTSGYTSQVLDERATLTADARVIEKPFTRTSLLTVVAQALTPPET